MLCIAWMVNTNNQVKMSRVFEQLNTKIQLKNKCLFILFSNKFDAFLPLSFIIVIYLDLFNIDFGVFKYLSNELVLPLLDSR